MEVGNAVPSQLHLALVGPCGSGKTSLARALQANNPSCTWIREVEPSPEMQRADGLTPDSAQRFQEEMTLGRQHQVLTHRTSRILIFDRTFEEDREVFLPLYQKLGYLSDAQTRALASLSLASEASVGTPHCTIMLTANLHVLKRRIEADSERRPRWLVQNLDIQYRLYADWAQRAAGRFIVQDVSETDPASVVTIVQLILDRRSGGAC